MRKPSAQAAKGNRETTVSHDTLNSPTRATRALVRTLRVELGSTNQRSSAATHCTTAQTASKIARQLQDHAQGAQVVAGDKESRPLRVVCAHLL